MLKRLLIICCIVLVSGCQTYEASYIKELNHYNEVYGYQEFDAESFLGVWKVRSKYNPTTSYEFKEDNQVCYGELGEFNYILKKDSIFILNDDIVGKGRLLRFEYNKVDIMWGNTEIIKYRR